MSNRHAQLELILRELCNLLDHPDFDAELTLAREFIDQAEYGAALLSLVHQTSGTGPAPLYIGANRRHFRKSDPQWL